jgi:adenylate cyclase class IV
MIRFKEIESKYDACDISMQSFIDLIEAMSPQKRLMVSSYDDYFIDSSNNFIRYRYNDARGELTIKRKLNANNNIERLEVNLPTPGDNVSNVSAFVNLLGYEYNFGIYKTCKIYWVDNVVVVYYVVYDKEMKELRRFIEIEADEHHNWPSEQEAIDKITDFERKLAPLGLKSRNRLKKSLFEIFRKQ